MVHREAAFRRAAYGREVLPHLTWRPEHWRREEVEGEVEEQSPRFVVGREGVDEEGRLGRLTGGVVGGSKVLYAGGPVWGLAWAPVPPGEEQVVAVAAALDHRTATLGTAGEEESEQGLVQVWRCGEGAPELLVGLVHPYGRVWEVAWCPSGGWTAGRLGLLAAACSDGSVRVWAVPRPGQAAAGLHRAEPALTLTLGGPAGRCLGLAWHRGAGHRHLAAGYSSGLVAVWDLATTSSLLRTSPTTLLPHLTWAAHCGSVTGVSFRPDAAERPRFLVSGGSDRHYRFWDLQDPGAPVQEVKRGLVTAVEWLPGWAAATVAYDDVYLQAHTQTLVAEASYSATRCQPVVAQNSGVVGLATSPWAAAIAVSTAAGELVLFVVPPADRLVALTSIIITLTVTNTTVTRSMEHDKNVCQRRTYVYRTEVELEEEGEEGEDRREYNSVRDSAVLRFVDLPCSRPGGGPAPLEEVRRVRCADRMQAEELATYPLAMLNRAAWNPNLGHHLLLASGGQAGLVRIHRLDALNTPAHRKAVAEVMGEVEVVEEEVEEMEELVAATQ